MRPRWARTAKAYSPQLIDSIPYRERADRLEGEISQAGSGQFPWRGIFHDYLCRQRTYSKFNFFSNSLYLGSLRTPTNRGSTFIVIIQLSFSTKDLSKYLKPCSSSPRAK